MKHNLFLVRDRIMEFSRKIRGCHSNWFKEQGINTHNRSTFVILSRNTEATWNEWNHLVTGMIIDFSDRLWSFPLTHIPVLGEQTNYDVSWLDCSLIKVMDGQKFNICFVHKNINRPLIHTDCAVSCSPFDQVKPIGRFFERIMTVVRAMPFSFCDGNKTFVCMEVNKTIHLLAMRDMETFDDYDEEELDATANRLKMSRPDWWLCREGLKDITTAIGDNHDNLIIRDNRTGYRMFIPKAESNTNNNKAYAALVNEKTTLLVNSIRYWQQVYRETDKITVAAMLESSKEANWIKPLVARLMYCADVENAAKEQIVKITKGYLHRVAGLR